MSRYERGRRRLARVYAAWRASLLAVWRANGDAGDAGGSPRDRRRDRRPSPPAAVLDAGGPSTGPGKPGDGHPGGPSARSGPAIAAERGAQPEAAGRPEPVSRRWDMTAYRPTASRDDDEVPHGLRVAAAWSWRLILIGIIVAVVLWLFARLQIVVVPLAIALLLSALLSPAVDHLLRARFPRSLATAVVLVGGLAAVAGTLTAVINQFVQGLPQLSENAGEGIRTIQNWLQRGPLHLSNAQLSQAIDSGQKWLRDHASLTGAVSTAATVFEVVTGLLLVLFATFFFLRDGRRIWSFLVGLLPHRIRDPIATAGEASWATLVAYVRATVLVAFIDAAGIGLALVILQVPFPLPLAALVFLGAFIPIVGATVSGAVAVLIALVDSGLVKAALVLAAVIAVQQLEGHVLQPFIMGRAVAIHPLAVIVAITTGVILGGIFGALVAVPVVAVLNTGIRRFVEYRRGAGPPGADPRASP